MTVHDSAREPDHLSTVGPGGGTVSSRTPSGPVQVSPGSTPIPVDTVQHLTPPLPEPANEVRTVAAHILERNGSQGEAVQDRTDNQQNGMPLGARNGGLAVATPAMQALFASSEDPYAGLDTEEGNAQIASMPNTDQQHNTQSPISTATVTAHNQPTLASDPGTATPAMSALFATDVDPYAEVDAEGLSDAPPASSTTSHDSHVVSSHTQQQTPANVEPNATMVASQQADTTPRPAMQPQSTVATPTILTPTIAQNIPQVERQIEGQVEARQGRTSAQASNTGTTTSPTIAGPLPAMRGQASSSSSATASQANRMERQGNTQAGLPGRELPSLDEFMQNLRAGSLGTLANQGVEPIQEPEELLQMLQNLPPGGIHTVPIIDRENRTVFCSERMRNDHAFHERIRRELDAGFQVVYINERNWEQFIEQVIQRLQIEVNAKRSPASTPTQQLMPRAGQTQTQQIIRLFISKHIPDIQREMQRINKKYQEKKAERDREIKEYIATLAKKDKQFREEMATVLRTQNVEQQLNLEDIIRMELNAQGILPS